MAAVQPTVIRHVGQTSMLVGTSWVHCKLLLCTFANVDCTAPDNWALTEDIGGTNTSANTPIPVAAWCTGATGEDANVLVSITAVSGATSAFGNVVFSGAEADFDGDVLVAVTG